MDTKTFEDIEFSKILELVSSCACSEEARQRILSFKFFETEEELVSSYSFTGELMELDRAGEGIHLPTWSLRLPEFFGKLEKSIPPSTLELLEIGRVIDSVSSLRRKLTPIKERAPELYRRVEKLPDLQNISKKILSSLDERGEVVSDASESLIRYSREKRRVEKDLEERLKKLIHSGYMEGDISEEVFTLRNGRYVIMVKAGSVKKYKGILHDMSGRGQTAYIEPIEVLNDNNRLQELTNEIENEKMKIVRELVNLVVRERENIFLILEAVSELDVHQARASFAREKKCIIPEIIHEARMKVVGARHPLLGQNAIPVDYELDEQRRLVVLSGPNAGGKTVLLKLTGLLAVMMRAGLPVPAKEGTALPFFRGVYTDIGDEQSIENSLSTFSAHITRLKNILERKPEGFDNLILLDELGGGTSPRHGAALAVAFLERLSQMRVFAFISTHYSELIIHASRIEGAIPASMQFNLETLTPTFRFMPMVPGSSFTIEVARAFNLDAKIIARAEELLGEAELEYSRLLERLSGLIQDYEKLLKNTQEEKAIVENLRKEYEAKLRFFDGSRRDVVRRFEAELRKIFETRLAELDRYFQEAREKKTSRREVFCEGKKQISETVKELSQVNSVKTEKKFRIGDRIHVTTAGKRGVIADVSEDNRHYFIELENGMKLWLESEILEPEQVPEKSCDGTLEVSLSNEFRGEPVTGEVHLRGMKVEDALLVLDSYLDRVLLAGLSTVRIVHGKGTFTLMKAIHEWLKSDVRVESFRPGHYGEGDTGVTVVSLKKEK